MVSSSKEVLNFHINFSFIHILWAIALSPRPLGPWVITTLENACEFKIWLSYLITYYLGSFNTGYIIFRIIEIFGVFFSQINCLERNYWISFLEGNYWNFKNNLFIKRIISKLIDYSRSMCLRCQSTMVDIIANCKVSGSKVINWIIFSFYFFIIMMYHT